MKEDYKFLSVIWVKWKQSVCSITLLYSSTFYSLLLPFFVLEIFKFKYDKVFVRHSASISKFEWFEQPCQNRKIHNSVKTYAIVVKYKLSECWWSVFVISAKKKFFLPPWAWPIMTPFRCKLGPKKQFLRGFTNLFLFKTAGLQHKLLILIVSPYIFHWKSAKNSKVGVVFGAKFGPK